MAQANTDRTVVWATAADWERPSKWPEPGRLLVTAGELRFEPRRQAGGWAAPLRDIVEVGVTDGPLSVGRGGRRKRIVVETVDGGLAVFAVAMVSHAVAVIRAAVRADGGDPAT